MQRQPPVEYWKGRLFAASRKVPEMIGSFEYVRTGSIDQGCSLLAEYDGQAVVLAGGTDLLVNIRSGIQAPQLLVDFKRINSLAQIRANEQGGVVIGAAVPLNALLENETIWQQYRALAEAAQSMGTYQVRNRATLAGNLCNASPAADTAPALLALNAHVTIASPRGGRTLAVRDLFVGVKQSALACDEVVTAVVLPAARLHLRTRFLKKQRIRGHDLAILNIAGAFDTQTGELSIAIGSCAETPILLPSLNEPVGKSDSLERLTDRLNELAQAVIDPITDLRASADYRRAMIPVFLHRLLETLLDPSDTSEQRGGSE